MKVNFVKVNNMQLLDRCVAETLASLPAENAFGRERRVVSGQERGSLAQAEHLAQSLGRASVRLCCPEPVFGRAWRGQLVAQTELHWVQQLAQYLYVAHLKSELSASLALNSVYEIQYPHVGRGVSLALGRMAKVRTAGQHRLGGSGMGHPRAVAFVAAPRAEAVFAFPELAGVYAVIDAQEAQAVAEFSGDERALHMVLMASKSAMVLQLKKGSMPTAEALSSALQQRAHVGRRAAVLASTSGA